MEESSSRQPDDEQPPIMALLDIFCKVDVVTEIQSENKPFIDLFDDIFTIKALFAIIQAKTTEHNGVKMYFPQVCADIFTCLPDSFIDDICSNDDLMESFFGILNCDPDTRLASCFCQMIERFVSTAPDIMYTYLQMQYELIIDHLLTHIYLSSYLNSCRYLLDIPIYNGTCWWGDSVSFMNRIVNCLENAKSSYNIKELLLSIIQRATVYNKEEFPRSSYRLLEAFVRDDCISRVFTILMKHLQNASSILEECLKSTEHSDWDVESTFVNGSMEISNNCFLVISRLFWKYSHGLTTGRGGYNTCFNTKSIPVQQIMRMGGIRNRVWMHSLSKQCKIYLPTIFNAIRSIGEIHAQLCSQMQKKTSSSSLYLIKMVPKPILGFCEFFYHYVHDRNDPKLLLHLLNHHYIDCIIWLMTAYPMTTNIHVNIVDVLITIVYSNNLEVYKALFLSTSILPIICQILSDKSLSPLKSQLNIFLQAVSTCYEAQLMEEKRTQANPGLVEEERLVADSAQNDQKKEPSSLIEVLQRSPSFIQITRIVDIFHIYEPLVDVSMMETVTSSKKSSIAKIKEKDDSESFEIPS